MARWPKISAIVAACLFAIAAVEVRDVCADALSDEADFIAAVIAAGWEVIAAVLGEGKEAIGIGAGMLLCWTMWFADEWAGQGGIKAVICDIYDDICTSFIGF